MWRRSRKSLHLDIRRDNVGWNRGRMGCLGTLVLSGCLGVSVLQQRRKGRKAGRVGCRGHSTHPELTGLHGFGRSPKLSSRDVSVSVGEQEMPLSCGLHQPDRDASLHRDPRDVCFPRGDLRSPFAGKANEVSRANIILLSSLNGCERPVAHTHLSTIPNLREGPKGSLFAVDPLKPNTVRIWLLGPRKPRG